MREGTNTLYHTKHVSSFSCWKFYCFRINLHVKIISGERKYGVDVDSIRWIIYHNDIGWHIICRARSPIMLFSDSFNIMSASLATGHSLAKNVGTSVREVNQLKLQQIPVFSILMVTLLNDSWFVSNYCWERRLKRPVVIAVYDEINNDLCIVKCVS